MAKTNQIDLLYESFMDCVDKAENAKSKATQRKWLKAAKEDYAQIQKHKETFSRSQLRRVERAMGFLEDMGD